MFSPWPPGTPCIHSYSPVANPLIRAAIDSAIVGASPSAQRLMSSPRSSSSWSIALSDTSGTSLMLSFVVAK